MGGIVVPAAIHYLLNHGTPLQRGAGIPMATDIAFSLGVLSLFGSKVPYALKVFLTATQQIATKLASFPNQDTWRPLQ